MAYTVRAATLQHRSGAGLDEGMKREKFGMQFEVIRIIQSIKVLQLSIILLMQVEGSRRDSFFKLNIYNKRTFFGLNLRHDILLNAP